MPNERSNVDRAIGRANEIIESHDFEGGTKDICRIAVLCTEAVVRQLRDLDDDVWQLKVALNGGDTEDPESVFGLVDRIARDLTITANRLAEAIEAASSHEKKRGMLG